MQLYIYIYIFFAKILINDCIQFLSCCSFSQLKSLSLFLYETFFVFGWGRGGV